jgi:hypothetical protein
MGRKSYSLNVTWILNVTILIFFSPKSRGRKSWSGLQLAKSLNVTIVRRLLKSGSIDCACFQGSHYCCNYCASKACLRLCLEFLIRIMDIYIYQVTPSLIINCQKYFMAMINLLHVNVKESASVKC